jgi:hypothetical protein
MGHKKGDWLQPITYLHLFKLIDPLLKVEFLKSSTGINSKSTLISSIHPHISQPFTLWLCQNNYGTSP